MHRLVITTVLVATLVVASAAPAAISVYKNGFDAKREYRGLHRIAGTPKRVCKKDWRKKESLGVQVLGGKHNCRLQTPVIGDAAKPNHIVKAVAKVTKDTHKGVLKATYVGVTVRAGRRGGYELRVFPKTRRWQLLKSGLVLEKGREREIKPARQKNRLRISADHSKVSAKVNGVSLTSFRDRSSEEVNGRGTGITYGVRKNAKKKKVAKAFFSKVKVMLP